VGRVAAVFAGGVAAVSVADGAAFHRIPRDFLARWGSTATTLASRPWRLVTSLAVTDGPRMTASVCAGLLISLTLAERRLGAKRALVAGTLGTLVGTVAVDAALLIGRAAGVSAAAAAARAPDYGASAISVGAAGALARDTRPVLAAVIALATLNGLLLNHTIADWEHLCAFVAGFALPPP